MKRFLLDSDAFNEQTARITGQEAHHARLVLRLSIGTEVVLMDGRGSEYLARIKEFDRRDVVLEIMEKRPAVPESPLELTLAVGVLKSEPMDIIVRQASELGVTRIIPLITEHTDIRLNSTQMDKRLDRWQRIAGQSIKQCRRGRPLRVESMTRLNECMDRWAETDLCMMLDPWETPPEGPGLRSLVRSRKSISSILALVGPEAGFTQEERELARAKEVVMVSAGPRILRAETAVLALCSILGAAFGDLG